MTVTLSVNLCFRQEKTVFSIANEIMTSERVFVNVLHLIQIDFREFVLAAMAAKRSPDAIIPREDFDKIFSNLRDLLVLNSDLLADFEGRVRHWDTSKKIADVIVRKGAFLKLYTTYIKDFMQMNEHFEHCSQRYPKFAKLVKEFEARDICQKLKLQHYMLKPVQVDGWMGLHRWACVSFCFSKWMNIAIYIFFSD
jgi:FYVE/RhoGEF/PH domain-containing protein 5/6